MLKNGRNQNELVADLLTNLSEEVNRLRQKESEQKMTIEELANEIDQLRQSYRRQQLTINRLNSEIGDLQAENKRLLEVIRLQAATHQEAPEVDLEALAVAAGQAGFGWLDND